MRLVVSGAILVAGEEYNKRASLVNSLRDTGFRVIEAESALRTIEIVRRQKDISIIFMDSEFRDLTSLELIRELRDISLDSSIVLIYDDKSFKLDNITQLLQNGADYLLRYNEHEIVVRYLTSILLTYKCFERHLYYTIFDITPVNLYQISSKSEDMKKTIAEAKIALSKDKTFFIYGENGTERRLFAKTIYNSKKGEGSFIEIFGDSYNPAATAEQFAAFIENDIRRSIGGALCLVNIDYFNKTQIATLHKILLEIKGDDAFYPFEIFFVTTRSLSSWRANANLKELLAGLDISELNMPPLRKRREDIEDLAEKIVWKLGLELGYKRKITGITGAAASMLTQYSWPDNIIELQKSIYHAMLISEGPLLKVKDFPRLSKVKTDDNRYISGASSDYFQEDGNIKHLADIENEVINASLEHYKGSLSEVARRLKIGRSTLYRKIEAMKKL